MLEEKIPQDFLTNLKIKEHKLSEAKYNFNGEEIKTKIKYKINFL